MADIAMCLKKDCPSFDNCKLAQSIANTPWQTYHTFDNGTDSKCADFVEYNPPKLDFLK